MVSPEILILLKQTSFTSSSPSLFSSSNITNPFIMISFSTLYISLFFFFSLALHLPAGKCPPQPWLKWLVSECCLLSPPLASFLFPLSLSGAVFLSPCSSSLTLSPHSLYCSPLLITSGPLLHSLSFTPTLLCQSLTHSYQLSLCTISTIGDPQCVCVLPGGRTLHSHHFHPGEFHGGCTAPSSAEHRAEDPGGSCCWGHAGPGSGGPHPCAGQLCWHRWWWQCKSLRDAGHMPHGLWPLRQHRLNGHRCACRNRHSNHRPTGGQWRRPEWSQHRPTAAYLQCEWPTRQTRTPGKAWTPRTSWRARPTRTKRTAGRWYGHCTDGDSGFRW